MRRATPTFSHVPELPLPAWGDNQCEPIESTIKDEVDSTNPFEERKTPTNEFVVRQNSPLEYFLSSFLHETSIRWMLLIGAAIVAVSSLKIVIQNWGTWSVGTKFLTMLAYTVVVAIFAETSDRWMKLKLTSNTLRTVTLILIPLCFFSFSQFSEKAELPITQLIPIFLVGTIACFVLARHVFKKWLCNRDIWSIVLPYFVLSAACTMPRFPYANLVAITAIWFIGCMGIFKANRHVYWLGEMNKPLGVMAFLPTFLIAGIMGLLLGSKFQWYADIPWLGTTVMLCVLPLCETTLTLYRVYQR